MKVLHVAETVKGGVATYLNLLSHVTGQQCTNVFLVPENQRTYIENESVGFSSTGRGVSGLLSMFKAFYRLYKNESPDIIFLHSTFAGLLRLFCIINPALKDKFVYCSHGWSFNMEKRKIILKLYAAIELCLSWLSAKIVCISGYEMSEAIRIGISKRKLIVIYNSLPESYELDSEFKPDFLTEEQQKYIVFIGRKSQQKGYDFLDYISRYLPVDYKIVVIGDFESSDFHSDRIIVAGWLSSSKINSILTSARALICPSRWEGFGFVVIESFRVGVPVIGSNRGALPELILPPLNGFTFDLDNLASTESIFAALDDEAKFRELKLNAKAAFLQRFTAEKFKTSILTLYKDLQVGK